MSYVCRLHNRRYNGALVRMTEMHGQTYVNPNVVFEWFGNTEYLASLLGSYSPLLHTIREPHEYRDGGELQQNAYRERLQENSGMWYVDGAWHYDYCSVYDCEMLSFLVAVTELLH